MSGSSFNLSMAFRSGYAFVAREWRYLARLSLLPLGALLITKIIIYHQPQQTSIFEEFMWSMPARALLAWLMFIEARLIVLGERVPYLPADPVFLAERGRALSACVLFWLLFVMANIALFAYLLWGKDHNGALVNLLWLFLVGMGVWGIRFGVVHILAAVGYPIREYIFRVNGIMISVRLVGLYILASMPVVLLQYGLYSLVLPQKYMNSMIDHPEILEKLPESTAMTLIAINSVTDVASAALLTAVFTYALKDMLGRPAPGAEKTA